MIFNKKKFFKKKSLMTQFILFSLSFVFLFIFIAFFSYKRLTDYKILISEITDSSIPKVITVANVYSHVNELVYLTEKLNNAHSDISRRITYKDITERIYSINEYELIIFDKKQLNNKFINIQKEFDTLNDLIKSKLVLQNKILEKIKELDTLNNLFITTFSQDDFNIWRLKFFESITISTQIERITRLNNLRNTKNKIEEEFEILFDSATSKIQKDFINKLKKILFGKAGLINLKNTQLKIESKSIGIGTFVNNLIDDFANEVEYLSVIDNEKLIKKSKRSFFKLETQIKYIFIFSMLGLFYLIFVIFYLRKKVVKRLINLNNNVHERLNGSDEIIEDKGTDEISCITQSFNFFASKVQEQNEKLQELTLTDSLTGIANRRLFDIRFDNELSLVKRYNHKTSIIMIDVDNFKAFNDNYGHLDGDECLKKIANTFKIIIKRKVDLVARYGGEEFICILSNTDIKSSKIIAQSLLEGVRELNISHDYNGKYSFVTISIGIKTISIDDCVYGKSNIDNADKALYMAKESGKNTFVHYDEMNM